jgi:hypothetical protein
MDKRLILDVVVLTTVIAIGTTALVSNPISFGVASTVPNDATYNSNTSQL